MYKWYYNSSLGQCHTFVYGGCTLSGAENKFDTEAECLYYCAGRDCKYVSSVSGVGCVGHVICMNGI